MSIRISWGEEDQWIPATFAQRFSELIPNNDVIIFDQAGHVPMEEIPLKTARAAREFLLN